MIKVLKSGFLTTIQDLGRTGYQKYGVPYSGAMDGYAASMANMILGNKQEDAIMEITMTGPTLQFHNYTYICISGANMSPKLNNENILLDKVIPVKLGDVLSFGKLNSGFRCYLAVLGGFQTEMVMQSRSMYPGITKQHKIEENTILHLEEATHTFPNQHASIRIVKSYLTSEEIDVYEGPEFNMLSKEQQEQLTSHSFTISKDNNRMAYQLNESLSNQLEPIITSSVLPGTVQLTPSGKLIVLMQDCQSTGGYPRVLQLKETAINVLAQKFTGQSISFKFLKY